MKLSAKDERRELLVSEDPSGGFILSEREKFTPVGYQRAKWDVSRVWISKDEVLELAVFVAKEQRPDEPQSLIFRLPKKEQS